MLKYIEHAFTSRDVQEFIKLHNISQKEYEMIYKKSYVSHCLHGISIEDLIKTTAIELRQISINLEILRPNHKKKDELINEINYAISKLFNMKDDIEIALSSINNEEEDVELLKNHLAKTINKVNERDRIIESMKLEIEQLKNKEQTEETKKDKRLKKNRTEEDNVKDKRIKKTENDKPEKINKPNKQVKKITEKLNPVALDNSDTFQYTSYTEYKIETQSIELTEDTFAYPNIDITDNDLFLDENYQIPNSTIISGLLNEMFEITYNQHHHLKYHNKQYMEYSCDTWIPISIDDYLHDLLINYYFEKSKDMFYDALYILTTDIKLNDTKEKLIKSFITNSKNYIKRFSNEL